MALVALVAGAMLGGGITPGEAARAVKRGFNADAVDGLSASRTPKAGRLLALGSDGRFPSAVLPPVARGPRGAQGPGGPPGDRGPSDAYVTRNNAGNGLPVAAPATIGALQLPAGAYALDFTAHTYVNGAGTFVDCQLSANGQQIVKTAARVGNDAPGTIEAVIALSDAATFAAATVVRALCSQRSEAGVQLTDARLRAIRVGSVAVQ